MTAQPTSVFNSNPDFKSLNAGLETFRTAFNRIKEKLNPNYKNLETEGKLLIFSYFKYLYFLSPFSKLRALPYAKGRFLGRGLTLLLR